MAKWGEGDPRWIVEERPGIYLNGLAGPYAELNQINFAIFSH